jgi:hypothetical protein
MAKKKGHRWRQEKPPGQGPKDKAASNAAVDKATRDVDRRAKPRLPRPTPGAAADAMVPANPVRSGDIRQRAPVWRMMSTTNLTRPSIGHHQ